MTRRSVLEASAATTGAIAVGATTAGARYMENPGEGENGENGESGENRGSDEKRGGRVQVEEEPRRNVPFELSDGPSGVTMGASCMSGESAPQGYLEYDIQYCDGEEDTMYVIPEEAELAQDEVYEFRAVQECKATDDWLAAFGPSNRDC